MTIRQRDREPRSPEFSGWYREAYPQVLAGMVVAAGNVETAKDVTQDAFVQALEHWPRVSAMDSPVGWVYRVAVNRLRRVQRRAGIERRLLHREVETDDRPPGTLPIEVWDAVRRLPPRARIAVGLRYLGDLPEAQVAAAMGVAVGTTARTLHDARQTLAATLNEPILEVPR